MIRKTLIAAAALAALTTGFAGGAEAKIAANGSSLNGLSLNAGGFNGISVNGLSDNGRRRNGTDATVERPALRAITLPNGLTLAAE